MCLPLRRSVISLNLLELLVCLYLALNFENVNEITIVLIALDQKKDSNLWVSCPPMINVK